MRCIAPGCSAARAPDRYFCAVHLLAPPGRRGGWLSAFRKKMAMAESETPLEASRVYDRIWVGSRPPFDQPLRHFNVLVLCAAELQPDRVAFAGDVIRPAIHDAALGPAELYRVSQAARYIAERHRRGQRCLVTCFAGLNRSSLVAGLALIQLTRMGADDVVMLIRHARGPNALHNPHFVALLRQAAATRGRRAPG